MAQAAILHNQSGNRRLGGFGEGYVMSQAEPDDDVEVGLLFIQDQGLGKVVTDGLESEHANFLVFVDANLPFFNGPDLAVDLNCIKAAGAKDLAQHLGLPDAANTVGKADLLVSQHLAEHLDYYKELKKIESKLGI